jgi:hypothetical protein
MIYQRYVVGPSDGTMHRGAFRAVHQLWENGDGTSMFVVECDDVQFSNLNANANLTVFPSLNAPATQLSAKAMAYLTTQAVTPAVGDEVLNVLRAVRDKKGVSVMIDNPA